jgi:hypothetical protein
MPIRPDQNPHHLCRPPRPPGLRGTEGAGGAADREALRARLEELLRRGDSTGAAGAGARRAYLKVSCALERARVAAVQCVGVRILRACLWLYRSFCGCQLCVPASWAVSE